MPMKNAVPKKTSVAKDPMRFLEPSRVTQRDIDYRKALESYIGSSIGSNVEKFQNFTKYVPCQDLRKFIARFELFKRVLTIQGSIIECGVFMGGGLMTWASLSEIYEPCNTQRKILGFDTFNGFTSFADVDRMGNSKFAKEGQYSAGAYEDLLECIQIFNRNRFVGHVEKVKLIQGDAIETIPKYLHDYPHTMISLLYLDFDLFEPTRAALKNFFPRMAKGSIVVFDELNHDFWPGETLAVMQEIGLAKLKFERFPISTTMSYAVLE